MSHCSHTFGDTALCLGLDESATLFRSHALYIRRGRFGRRCWRRLRNHMNRGCRRRWESYALPVVLAIPGASSLTASLGVPSTCSYEATRGWISISERRMAVKWEMALRRIARPAACSGVSSGVARTRSATKPMKRTKNRVVASTASSTSGWTSSTDCAWINPPLRTSAAIHWSEQVETGIDN
jgi:hypothetical protein